MQQKFFHHQFMVKINMVKMHQREQTGISPAALQVKLYIDAFKGMLQSFGNKTARPFIEIADQQPRMLQRRRKQHLTAHEHARLLAALNVSGAQMNIEEVNNFSRRDLQITADTSARFTRFGRREVVDMHFLER